MEMAMSLLGRTITKVGVVGSGNIGPDIALYFGKVLNTSCVPVVVVDIRQEALDAGAARLAKKLSKGVEGGAFKKEEAEAIQKAVTFTPDYQQLSGADFIIEAATEDVNIKRKIFSQLEKLCAPNAILASNSSHMEPEVIFTEIKDRSRTLVIHYFFPAERNPMIEVVPGKDTSADTASFCMRLYEQIGKVPVRVKSRYGYAVDPVFEGLFQAAALIVESGVASVKVVDEIAKKALGLGIGPFTAMNLTGGNPITNHGLDEMHKVVKWYRSPNLMKQQCASGKPWETAGRGETPTYPDDVYQKVSDEMIGAFFGICCEIVDSGITNVADMNMAVETALVMNAPFTMMNKLGVRKSYELVKAYARKHPDFTVAKCLEKQAESGQPWRIPVVVREDMGNVAVVTIRRPKVLNALNVEVVLQLRDAFEGVENDAKIKAAVLTGFGTKSFVSGADINELAALKTPEEGVAMCLRGQAVLNYIENLKKPVVCAMNGLAFGGGNELAMSCHVRIAKKGQKVFVGQPEPKLGIIPGYGGTQRFPRLVGLENAWPILRNGNPISSEHAKKIGLVLEEITGDMVEEGVKLAQKIASGEVRIQPINRKPLDVPANLPQVDIGHLSKRIDELVQKAVVGGAKMTLEEGLKHEARTFGECLNTKDTKIGMDNFLKNGPKVNAGFVHA
jgi:enoyl-CoA hydratase/3-hydroxyacyl-CoA dehydrogenase